MNQSLYAGFVPLVDAAPRALAAAADWCDRSENHATLAELLARPEYLGTDPEWNLEVLGGSLPMACGKPDPDYLYLHRHDAFDLATPFGSTYRDL